MKKYPPCLNHPRSPGNRRGLCNRCYIAMINKINNGTISDKTAVRKGIILPRKKPGRPRSIQPFPQI